MTLISAIPWLMFGGTMLTAAWLNGGLTLRKPVVGFAQGDQETIASLESGRIVSMAVEAGQEVAQGQVVARLDSSALDSEIAVAEAEQKQLEARIDAVAAEAKRKEHFDSRQLVQGVDQIRVALSREEAAQVQARAQEEAMRAERDRLKGLVADRLATADDLAKVEVQYAAIAREVEERPKNIALLKAQLEDSEASRTQAPSAYADVLTVPLQRELEVARRKLEWLQKRREALALRAPVSGRILSVNKRPGEVAAVGEVLATLVRSRSSRVVACVTEQDALEVHLGDHAKLWVRNQYGEPLSGRAVALGPLVDQVQVRCRRVPTMPAWGRDVTIQLDHAAELVPGEAFDVRFEPGHSDAAPTMSLEPAEAPPLLANVAPIGGSMAVASSLPATPAVASTPRAAADGMSQVIQVPEMLAQTYHLEPSGLTWRPELARYVVVSDDTGLTSSDKHAPVLFSMSMDGRIDPAPLAVNGVSELNDLESISAAEDGSLYVLSSQSYSHKGNRKPSRTAFLKLVREAKGYRVVGEAHLAELIDAAGPSLLARLGLPADTRALNIEGMASWQGALYLGLKAPLDEDGNSLIWKLGKPEALLAGGRLEDAELSLWARVKLDAEAEGKTVPGGIAELLFLPDGSLVLTSTPSAGGEGTGRLWHVTDPAPGVLMPRLVRSFTGLKPEALSLSPTPGRLMIAFDAGQQTPHWMEMPWPH